MLNHITLMGRLTRDPELRYTQTGTPVASFTLAVDRDFASRDGGDRQTDFIDVVAWRQTGEFVSKYFTKGQMAAVSGRLQIREWTDREGGKRRNAEVVADNVYFAESKKTRDGDNNSGDYYRNSGAPSNNNYGSHNQNNGYGGFDAALKTGSAFEELDDGDGELPF